MDNDTLIFRVREKGHAHPSSKVRATGAGHNFRMQCDCLAGLHGAMLCPHIVAVLRKNKDLVMSGRAEFEELEKRSRGSQVADPDNEYWKFHPPE